jgi:hypothetical protein
MTACAVAYREMLQVRQKFHVRYRCRFGGLTLATPGGLEASRPALSGRILDYDGVACSCATIRLSLDDNKYLRPQRPALIRSSLSILLIDTSGTSLNCITTSADVRYQPRMS